MNSKDIGDKTVALVMAALIRQGKTLLLPFGDNRRYDLAIDEGGQLIRVQCKTARFYNGAVTFKTCSTYRHRGHSSRCYRGEAELFGVYCPETDKVYLVPVNEVGQSEAILRVEPAKGGQKKGIRLAELYEI